MSVIATLLWCAFAVAITCSQNVFGGDVLSTRLSYKEQKVHQLIPPNKAKSCTSDFDGRCSLCNSGNSRAITSYVPTSDTFFELRHDQLVAGKVLDHFSLGWHSTHWNIEMSPRLIGCLKGSLALWQVSHLRSASPPRSTGCWLADVI